jgi:hypothetical protein
MKKMMMLVMMTMMVAIAAQAKDDKVTITSGNGQVMKEAGKTATLEIDYSKTIVEGKAPLMEYLQQRGEKNVKDWPETAAVAQKQLTEQFNKRNKKGLQIVESGDADYKIKFIVEKLDFGSTGVSVVFGGLGSAGGAEVTGTLVVSDKSGNEVVTYDVHEVRGTGTTDFTETRRIGTCYENVVKMVLKASK